MGKAGIIIQIFTLANNRALRWSLASFVSSPLIRFWNSLTALQAAAVISTLVLMIGAGVEYWYKLKFLAFLLLKWILRKSTPFDRCALRRLLLHSVGPILVVLGIAGEFIFEGRTFIVEDREEEQARNIVGSLEEQAESAQKSLGVIEDQENAAKKENDELIIRLAKATEQLEVLESHVRVQGPRWQLLEDGKETFVNALKPFAGQRLTIVRCGLTSSSEQYETEQSLINLLGNDGTRKDRAGWAMDHPGYMKWPDCSYMTSSGLEIVWNESASRTVKDASKALTSELKKLEIYAWGHGIQSAQRQLFLTNLGADSPEIKAIDDPSGIFLVVWENPMVKSQQTSVAKTKTQKNH